MTNTEADRHVTAGAIAANAVMGMSMHRLASALEHDHSAAMRVAVVECLGRYRLTPTERATIRKRIGRAFDEAQWRARHEQPA